MLEPLKSKSYLKFVGFFTKATIDQQIKMSIPRNNNTLYSKNAINQ